MTTTSDTLFQWVQSFEGHWALRVLLAVVCAALGVGVLRGWLKGALSRIAPLFVFPVIGLGLWLAIEPRTSTAFVSSIPYLTRIRFVFGAVSLLVLLTTFATLRRTHLQERYAILWMLSSSVILLMALFPDILGLVRILTGLPYENAMAALVSIALLLVCFHFSLALSSLTSKLHRLAQRVALLEQQLQQAEAGEENGEQPEEEDLSS